MTKYVMRVWGTLGTLMPQPTYLESYDPNGPTFPPPRFELATFTGHIDKAKRFDDIGALFEEWKRERTVAPRLRIDDGKPDRPLSAFSIEAMEVSK